LQDIARNGRAAGPRWAWRPYPADAGAGWPPQGPAFRAGQTLLAGNLL